MIIKKCPLCSGTVSNGQCIDCGYFLPDEEEMKTMSSLYDFDPDNYPEPEKYSTSVEELGAELKYAEPVRAEVPKVEVVRSEKKVFPAAAPVPPPQQMPLPQQNSGNSVKFSFSAKSIRRNFWVMFLVSLLFPVGIFPGVIFGALMIKRAENMSETILGILCIIASVIKL